MKLLKGNKLKFAAALLACSSVSVSHAVPGTGLYDWWGGSVHFTDGTSRIAWGGSASSCTQDLQTQRQIGMNYNKVFSHYVYCTKSQYPRMHLLPMQVRTPDDAEQYEQLEQLEQQYMLEGYRSKVEKAKLAHKQRKLRYRAEYIGQKGSDELDKAELEYLDMMSYSTMEAELRELAREYRLEQFKQEARAIIE